MTNIPLSQVVDATILETRGFGVMKDQALQRLFRQAAEKRGLILLTDSDGAGFVIRNYLKGLLPAGLVKQAYIPDISGKERRKATPEKRASWGWRDDARGASGGSAPGRSHLGGGGEPNTPGRNDQGRSV